MPFLRAALKKVRDTRKTEEKAVEVLAAIRFQFSKWEGGHVWDEHICLLCGQSDSKTSKCIVEMFRDKLGARNPSTPNQTESGEL
jgi:hypothetical protein